jgi:hypothetical protein
MTRRLTEQEQNALNFVANHGGSYCPNDDALTEPGIMDTLNGLKRKKRLSVSAEDGAPPMFSLTSLGRQEAEHG